MGHLAASDPRFLRVGLVGHSEGSLIGMLAAKQAKVDAFVSLAGSGRAAPALIRAQLDTKLPPNLKATSNQILDELVAGRAGGLYRSLAPDQSPSLAGDHSVLDHEDRNGN